MSRRASSVLKGVKPTCLGEGRRPTSAAKEVESWLRWNPLSCIVPFCSVLVPAGVVMEEPFSDGEDHGAGRSADEVDDCSPATCATTSTRLSLCDADDWLEEDDDEEYEPLGLGDDAEDDEATPRGRSSSLRLDIDCRQVPHPDKAHYGGEDAVFVCEHGSAAGVADGVGEWASKFGVNPRFFAKELMDGCQKAVQASHAQKWWKSSDQTAAQHAEEAMAAGYESATSYGAATVCVMAFDPARSEVGVASLGDSGMRLLRRSQWTGRMYVAGRTKEQHHGFNRPFQLTRLPRPEEFPRLIALGLTRLVRSAERRSLTRTDAPADAGKYVFPIEEGDVIVMGSDGLFDNLNDYDICRHVDSVMPSPSWRRDGRRRAGGIGERVAQLLAQAAASRAKDDEGTTPWTLYTRKHGIHYPGGKLDDITVVAAHVTR